MKRVLVCGGRDFADNHALNDVLDYIHADLGISLVISGGAKGADTLALRWAERAGVASARFPADWEKHAKAAGPIRNQQMLDEGKPNLVVAFPGGKGTADMVRRATSAGIPVRQAPLSLAGVRP